MYQLKTNYFQSTKYQNDHNNSALIFVKFFSIAPTTFTSRLAGFSLYVSNTTSKDDGHLCFHEIQNAEGTPSEDQRIQCPFHARYVIYYNERRPEVVYPSYYSEFAYSDLCEVKVYGRLIVTNERKMNCKESK